ncbi:MAG: hypothetical protein P9X27_01590 [Candidatus Kaelpia aquatica]|nr:hypothetical protein [Candidatus Kaelpia aquatica]
MKKFFKTINRDSVLKKVLKFYYNNPGSIDTAESIAKWIGEEESLIAKQLEYLMEKNILNKDKSYAMVVYSYTQDKHIIAAVKEFMEGEGRD